MNLYRSERRTCRESLHNRVPTPHSLVVLRTIVSLFAAT